MCTPRFAFLVAFLVFSIHVWPASAQVEPDPPHPNEGRDYSRFYNGSFWEISARGAFTSAPDADLAGWSADVGFRHAFPMQLLDSRLSYRHDQLTGDDDETLVHHRVGLHLGVHPVYFFILGSDWLAYVISSVYLELGMAAQMASYGEDDDLEMVWTIGGGFDVPLADADVGYAPWLNVVYRYSASGFDRPESFDLDTDQHTFFIGLGWRVNGLLF